jgi:hypothetical protein
MFRYRVFSTVPDRCCLPTPYRIPRRVAGMAFNFSEVTVRSGSVKAEQRETSAGAVPESRSAVTAPFLFGVGQFSAAT